MLSEKALRVEYKRLPKILKNYIKRGDLEEAYKLKLSMETIDWILNDNED